MFLSKYAHKQGERFEDYSVVQGEHNIFRGNTTPFLMAGIIYCLVLVAINASGLVDILT